MIIIGDPACADPTPICDTFSAFIGGEAECVAACTSDTDCTSRTIGLFTPFCDTTSGECVICQQDDDCLDSALFPNTTYCIDGGFFFDGNICSEDPSPFCSSTTECQTNFGETSICIEYTSETAPDFGVCVNASDAGACTSQADCADGGPFADDGGEFFAELDVTCRDLTVPANISGTIYSASLSFCVPEDQCSTDNDDDCLVGSECREFDFDEVFSFSICYFANNTCSTAADCNEDGSDGPLACYEPESQCYLPCTSNEDCRNENVNNWACGTPPTNTTEPIQACIPLGIENTTYLTNSPTAAPADGPADGGSGAALQIFGAFVIMILNSVFN